jgi:hypothetical protein
MCGICGIYYGRQCRGRSRFLDVDPMELALRILADARVRGAEPKSLLLHRLALRSVPPRQRRKQRFLAPIGQWHKDWSDVINDLVLGPQVEQRGWLQRNVLELYCTRTPWYRPLICCGHF